MREVLISLIGGVMPQKAQLFDSGLIYLIEPGEWSHITRELQQQRVVKDFIQEEKKSPGRPRKKE